MKQCLSDTEMCSCMRGQLRPIYSQQSVSDLLLEVHGELLPHTKWILFPVDVVTPRQNMQQESTMNLPFNWKWTVLV